MTPTVSVCVQTYNHEKYIKECLDGILMQKTTFPFEIILGEDESNDGTREICKVYAEKHPDKIKLFLRNRKDVIYVNGKPTGRFNFLENLKSSRGKYIALCEGDDYWTDPLKLQKQVDFLEANPEYIMCFTNTNVVDEHNNIIDKNKLSYTKTVFEHIDMPMLAPTLTRVMRNKYLDDLDFSTVQGGDNYLLTYHSQFGKSKFLDFVSAHYRIHSGGVYSSLNEDEKIMHLISTRMHCLFVAQYELKLKLYETLLIKYGFKLCNSDKPQYLRKFLKEIKLQLKTKNGSLNKSDSFRVKKAVFLLNVYSWFPFHKIRKLSIKSINAIYSSKS